MLKKKGIKTFETFREVSDYTLTDLTWEFPSCFNGNVSVKKFKITIEEIEEPKEIIAERLQKLWDECSNWYYWDPLKYAAKKIEYELKNQPGSKKC